MCGIFGWGIAGSVLGVALVVVSCVVSFVVLPNIIENTIISETVLKDDSIQLERFEEIPFPLEFSVKIFNITNSEEFLSGGVPIVEEIGPYVYKLYQTREIVNMDEDRIWYKRHERFEFDAEASYPLTESDHVTVINIAYHAILQVTETLYPNLMSLLNTALESIFGEFNTPVMTVPVQDLLFNGIPICLDDRGIVPNFACNQIREIGASAQNLVEMEDGSLRFSVLDYKRAGPSKVFEVFRGLEDHRQLGEIITYDNSSFFNYWLKETVSEEPTPGRCNMINGTDSAIYAPFIDKDKPLYAINTDVCRSLELRYEEDSEYEGIPALRFSAKEWFLDNDEGCFCLNTTLGINREDGCLLKGAMELYSCVGAYLVLSYPHFLFADEKYKEGVVGLNATEEIHKIFLDIEPNTGVPVRGYKRAQFNIFARKVDGIEVTHNINTALMPILWIEEGISLPEDLVDEIKTQLLSQLRLVDILVPVLITISCVILVVGVVLVIVAKCRKPSGQAFAN